MLFCSVFDHLGPTHSRHDTTWTFVLIGVAVVASVVLLYLCWTCCTQGCRSIVPSQGSRPGSARGGAENDGGEVGGGGEGGRRRRGSSADGEEQAGGGRRNQDALMRAVRSSGRPLVVDRVSSSGSNNIGSNPRHNSNYDNVSIRNADLNTPRMESSPREGVEGISRPYRRSGPDRGRYQTQLQQLQPQRERNQQQNSADDDKNDNATVQPLPSSPFPPAPLSQSPQEYSWRHPQPPVTMIHEEKQHNSKNITTSTPSLALSVTPPPPSIPYSAFSTPSSCPPVLTPISTSSGPPPAPPTPLTSTLPQPLPSHVPSSDPSTPTTATRTALPGSLIHVNPPGGPDLVPSIPPRPILTTGTGSS